MKIDCDYHTHTIFSHGKGTILDNAKAAADKGLKEIWITDHGFAHPAYGMRRRELDKMRSECEQAEKLTGVRVRLSTEANLLGESGVLDVKKSDYEKLDGLIAGIHRFVLYETPCDLFKMFFANARAVKIVGHADKSLIEYNTRAYINAVKNNPIDVLTHVGYLNFCDPVEVAKCCADYGTYFEINTKKEHLSVEQWLAVIDTKVDFVIDSDAHSPERVGDVTLFEKIDGQVHFPLERIFNVGGKTPKFRFAELKKRS